jgi:hypothetical protein
MRYSVTTILILLCSVCLNSARAGSGRFADEFLIDTSTALIPLGSANVVQVVSDSTDYLMVWTDNRRTGGYGYPDVYCARITGSGTLLDSGGIVVYDGEAAAGQFTAAYDGTDYAVTWVSGDSLRFCRVTRSGVVLDPGGRGVCRAVSSWGWYPSGLAFDGQNYLAVWSQWIGGDFEEDIYAIRISRDGLPLDSMPFPVVHYHELQYHPRVVFAGDFYFVAWLDWRNYPSDAALYGSRVSRAGVVLDTAGIVIDTVRSPWAPELATDGSSYLVARYDDFGACATKISQQGVPQLGILLSSTADAQLAPAASFGQGRYHLAWWDSRSGRRELYGGLMDTAGHLVQNRIWGPWSRGGTGTYLARSQSDYLIVWDGGYALRTDASGQPLDSGAVYIPHGTRSQSMPCAVSDGVGYLGAWCENRDGEVDVYAARIDASGNVLDPAGFKVSGDSGSHSTPIATFDGNNYLVIWQCRGIHGSRVSRAGVVLDTNPIFLSPDGVYPSVTFDGRNFVCAWSSQRSCYFARLNREGVLLDTDGVLVFQGRSSLGSSATAAAAGDSNTLLVWEVDTLRQQQPPPTWQPCYLRGIRIDQAGRMLDTSYIAVSREGAVSPRLVFDGDNYLAVWPGIKVTRITQDGIVLDTIAVQVVHTSAVPSVGFNAPHYLIVWSDGNDIFGATLDRSAHRTDSFAVVRLPKIQDSPVLAVGSASQELLLYRGWTTDVEGRHYNSMRIWGILGSFPGIEESRKSRDTSAVRIPTLVRNLLLIPRGSVSSGGSQFLLLNIAGRRVHDLHPGLNDVRNLACGVYFVTEYPFENRGQNAGPNGMTKVVISR